MTIASARHILVETEEECLKLRGLILDEGEDFSEIARNIQTVLPKNKEGT